jgi:hypothetical protein
MGLIRMKKGEDSYYEDFCIPRDRAKLDCRALMANEVLLSCYNMKGRKSKLLQTMLCNRFGMNNLVWRVCVTHSIGPIPGMQTHFRSFTNYSKAATAFILELTTRHAYINLRKVAMELHEKEVRIEFLDFIPTTHFKDITPKSDVATIYPRITNNESEYQNSDDWFLILEKDEKKRTALSKNGIVVNVAGHLIGMILSGRDIQAYCKEMEVNILVFLGLLKNTTKFIPPIEMIEKNGIERGKLWHGFYDWYFGAVASVLYCSVTKNVPYLALKEVFIWLRKIRNKYPDYVAYMKKRADS